MSSTPQRQQSNGTSPSTSGYALPITRETSMPVEKPITREQSLPVRAGGGLMASNMLRVAEEGLRKSTMALASAAASGFGGGLSADASALKKSSMALAALSQPAPAIQKSVMDISGAGAKVDASVLGNVIIPGRPVAVQDRPQVWTKSTTKGAEDNRRESLPSIQDGNKPRRASRGTLAAAQLQDVFDKLAKKQQIREEDKNSNDESGDELPELQREDSAEKPPSQIRTIQKQNSIASNKSQKGKKKATDRANESHFEFIAQSTSSVSYKVGKRSIANSRTSLLVENVIKNIENLGKPLRGPILLQFGILYVIFLVILFTSWATNWAPAIRLYTTLIYFTLACIVLQCGRIAYAKNLNSVVAVYLSLIPFVTAIFISREAHATVFVLWFVSTGFIFLQSGHPYLRLHLIAYYFLLIISYIIVLVVMSNFYKEGCSGWSCGEQLRDPIVVTQEAVLLFDCVMVMLSFLALENFIKINALTLLERDSYMNQLVEANEELKKQLNGDEVEEVGEVDLEAPLLRATQILAQLKQRSDLDRMVKDEIDFIIGVLSEDTDKLFKPDLYQKPDDADVHDWLNDMMLAEKTSSRVQSTAFLANTTSYSLNPMVDIVITPGDQLVFDVLSERMEDPEFDIFEIRSIAEGRCLYYVGWYLFRKLKFSETLSMDEGCFRRWLTVVESGYLSKNPYHNAYHAADVTHSMHYYVTRPRIWDKLKPEEKIAVIIAPIIHDYNHPEHYHCASIYELMAQSEYNIFAGFSPDAHKLVREMIVSMVLATDMAVHFDWIGKFKNKMVGNGIDFENKQDRKLLLNLAMKCADINNPSKKLEYCKKWTEMIMNEFFNQGDEETRLGLKVSMFMDRDTTDIPKCQVGFIDFIVRPLYEAWSQFMKDDVDKHLANITSNKAFWKSASENPSLFQFNPSKSS